MIILAIGLAHGEDWEYMGHTLHNVQVQNVYPDRVEITYDGGVGSPAIKDLSPDLQKRFNYDLNAAKIAADKIEADRNKAIAEAIKNAPSAPKPDVVLTPTNTKSVDEGALAQRRQRIAYLIADIASKEKEMQQNNTLEKNHTINSQSSFRGVVAAEKAELQQLQSQ